jgi:hypothetical protein
LKTAGSTGERIAGKDGRSPSQRADGGADRGIGGAVAGFAEDPAVRADVERFAMEAMMAHERALDNLPRDVSTEKKGWDIESRDGRTGHLRFIEVEGRHADAREVIVTKNEILASLNAPGRISLGAGGSGEWLCPSPVYVQRFFRRELGFAETAIVFNLADLLSLAERAM